ncbi:hypothetical protein JTE90_002443 [Oedothorax gibbosus]|uniref:Major facilitator superfamily (MFS) profile domain-containing protein n=1 Tax=Oedothorax gibbosus TaxID=931172 RepID=A0AAV6U7H1_9ARAC|nr:hypothetical protein JTE90_002443 [Oedothorax gibbosus]
MALTGFCFLRMLSPIDEERESVQRLDSDAKPESCPEKSLPQMVGGHGPWQLRHWALFLIAGFGCSLHLFSVYPFSSAVDCSCGRKEEIYGTETSSTSPNSSELIPVNKACFYGAFLNTKQDSGICPNGGLVIYAKGIYFVGILLSGLTTHFLIFRFGKRITALVSCALLLVSSVAVAWVQNTGSYLVLRLIISFGMMNVYLLSVSTLKEFMGEEYILVYGLTGHIGWSLAHLLLPLAAWLAGNWFNFSISAACIAIVLFIFLCSIPESVEDFLSKGLNTRAQKVIRQAAWCNGYHTQDVEYFTQNLYQHETKENLKIRCQHVDFKRYFDFFLRFLMGLSASFLYFTSVWLTDWRKDDRSDFYALAGTTEFAASLVLLFFTCFVPPKHLWSAATVLASGSLLLMYATTNNESPISTPPYLLTMFFSSSAFTVVLMQTLFHRPCKSVSNWNAVVSGVALCFGAILAALVDFQKFHGWNPKLFVIFAIPNLTIGCSIAVIPERYFTL